MKSLPIIVGLVAAGAVGALAATVMHNESGAATLAPPKEDPRIQELVVAVERLRREMKDLKAAPPVVANAPRAMAATTEAPASMAGVEMDAVGADDPAAAPAAKQIEEVVSKAVAASRKKEMEAIGKMWAGRAAQREKDMVTEFAKDQNLTDYQRDEMVKILDTRREKLGPFYRAMFTPAPDGETRDFAKIQQDMEKVRDSATEEMKTLLSAEQVEAFEKKEESQRGRWGMGGSRRRSNDDDNNK